MVIFWRYLSSPYWRFIFITSNIKHPSNIFCFYLLYPALYWMSYIRICFFTHIARNVISYNK